MSFFNLDDGLIQAINIASKEQKWELLRSQGKAIKLMSQTISGDINLAAIQGPPGTGKTSVVEAFARNELPGFISKKEKEIVIYIAPTNHLVFQAFIRIAAELIRAGFDLRTILNLIRVYGSKIRPYKKRNRIEFNNISIDSENLNQIMAKLDENVKLILATEFQRISYKLGQIVPDAIHIVADEASKSPFFRIFLSLAEKIAKNPEEFYPNSLLVLGDPQQAIGVNPDFKFMNVPLLIRHVEGILGTHHMKDKNWVMLDTTFRLPHPSENPISQGYYDNKLSSQYTAKERMTLIKDNVLDNFNKILSKLTNQGLDIKSNEVVAIRNAVEESLSSDTPTIIFRTESFSPGDTFDRERVRIASVTSAIFQIGANLSENRYSVTTTAPYSDIVDSVSLRNLKLLGEKNMLPNAVTVQSLIGGESDVIIAPLGKEWDVGSSYSSSLASMGTIYGREPEIFNVQLSRHRNMLILIGNIDNMNKFKDERIQKTVDTILEMEKDGSIVTGSS